MLIHFRFKIIESIRLLLAIVCDRGRHFRMPNNGKSDKKSVFKWIDKVSEWDKYTFL